VHRARDDLRSGARSEIEVPCATGKVVMKIQPLTQSGRVYRLKGLGLAGADQLVTIDVQIPKYFPLRKYPCTETERALTRAKSARIDVQANTAIDRSFALKLTSTVTE